MHAVATIWNTRTLRLPSVVSAVWAQVTVTVNPDKDPASAGRFWGDAGQVGMTIGEQLPAFSVLFGSRTCHALHSIPARALWYARAPSTITLSPAKQFPFSSPGKRFNVVQYAVTYACNQTTGQLRRYWGYGIVDPQPTPPAGGSNALLASNVAACSFTYANTGAAQRTGVVMLSLQIQESGSTDSIQLFQQVHVTNVP